MFLTGLIGFTAASAVGGLAPVFPLLLAARVIQGIGGALMLPCSVAIVSSVFRRKSEVKRWAHSVEPPPWPERWDRRLGAR